MRGPKGRWIPNDFPVEVTPRQEQIFMGTILGDGNLKKRKGGRNSLFRVSHCEADKDYVFWKYQELGSTGLFLHKPKRRLNNNGFGMERRSYRWELSSRRHIIFSSFEELFYPNGEKRITREILDRLEPLGLAVWYMDDGSYPSKDGVKGGRLSLSIQSFTEEEARVIQWWFWDKFGLKFSLSLATGGRPVLWIYNKPMVAKFLEVVRPYVIPCMARKVGVVTLRREQP